MSEEAVHIAHPRLYGAPAYARPPSVTPTTLPLHPDDLPIAAEQTTQERAIAEVAIANKYGIPEAAPIRQTETARSRSLSLGAIAKVLRRAS